MPAPTAPDINCQPTVAAPSLAEPAMPDGVDLAVLQAAMIRLFGEDAALRWKRWFETTHRGWAQEGWRRLDRARAQPPCAPPSG